MKAAYVDTSCLVAIAFGEPGSARMVSRLKANDVILASGLVEAELKAALIREGLSGEAVDFLPGLDWVVPDRPLGPEIDRVLAAGYVQEWGQAPTILGRCAVRTTTDSPVDVRRMKREPTHPGVMLLEEFLKPLGISQAEASRRMHVSTNRLNELIRGKRGVTAETALRLAELLGTSPEFWLHLQTSWDLWHAYRTERRSSAA